MAGGGEGGPEAAGGEIAIRLPAVARLFSALDPSPWPEKDLAPDADLHIRDWARALPRHAPLRIVVELPPGEAARAEARAIPAAIAAWYRGLAEARASELRALFRTGRLSLVIGLAALAVCVTASQQLAPLVPDPALARILEEGLLILGWVANWRPLEIYLYDWWPIRAERRLAARLAGAAVTVRAAG